MSASSTPRRKPGFPGSLTDLHRFRKTAHGHDGSSRIVMVRKTDRRTIASIQNGQEPKLETITRETIETFRGERTECKVTTEKTDLEDNCPPGIFDGLTRKSNKKKTITLVRNKANSKMDFANECLDAHNELRKKHGVAPLKLSRDICKVSQDWANNLIRKANLMHSNNRDYGENLFAIQSSNPNFSISGKEAVQNWYDEIKVHKFGVEPSSLASGHFTQVIWKDSKELGIAFAKSGGKIIVVANYFPAGNVLGTFAKNVPPLTSNNNNNSTPDLSSALGNLSLSQSQISSKITDGNFEQDFLQAHNGYREKHGVLPLSLDPKLCKYSQEWAKHLASKNILEHRPGSNYGENIYCLYTSDPNYKVNGNAPVDSWYEEISEHPFGKEPSSLKSGHFTQVVWKDSKTLGVGVAKNSQGSIYVVANYHPAGNFVGHFVENVLPLRRSGGMAENLAAKPVAAASGKFTQFAVDALNVHNEYRKRHGVGAMVLTEELCKVAQNWADTCAKEASLTHRANNSYGENIFCVYSSDYDHTPSARDAVKEWYDEVKKHTFGVEKVNQATLHFTQVIWKDSTQLGVGIAKNKKGQTYVVANYNPRGNFIGQFVANVPKAKA